MATDKQFLALYHLWLQKNLRNFTPAEFMVWVVLKMHERVKLGISYPSEKTIAEEAGIGLATVKRSLIQLESDCFISIKQQERKRGGYYNIYIMHI